MPDLISHAIIGLLICEVINIKPKSLVILGAVLPDLLLKWELLHLFFPLGDKLFWFLMPMHTPIGLILSTFIIMQFFKYDNKKSFILISAGWLSHILSDFIFNRHFLAGNFLLFPFSWKTFEIGLVWPEEFHLILIPLLAIYLIIKLIKRIRYIYLLCSISR